MIISKRDVPPLIDACKNWIIHTTPSTEAPSTEHVPQLKSIDSKLSFVIFRTKVIVVLIDITSSVTHAPKLNCNCLCRHQVVSSFVGDIITLVTGKCFPQN